MYFKLTATCILKTMHFVTLHQKNNYHGHTSIFQKFAVVFSAREIR
jgi:hypothetical protein